MAILYSTSVETCWVKMLPYSRGLILDNSNNYGIVKTETVFGFTPNHDILNNSFDSTEPLEWIITRGNFERRSLESFEAPETARSLQTTSKPETVQIKKRSKRKVKKKIIKNKVPIEKHIKRKGKGKVNKCIFKVLKKGGKKKKKGHSKYMSKKFMFPIILGLLAAKSLLIPVALKALAFISAKGFIMGLFSTVVASVLSLKGMFDQHHHYQNRKDDTKTQVEIIQVPSKTEEHYYDEHYRRGDYVPMLPPAP